MYAVASSAMLMSGLSWLSASFAQPDSRHVDSNMTRNLFMNSFLLRFSDCEYMQKHPHHEKYSFMLLGGV
jgi:hypothetical protein